MRTACFAAVLGLFSAYPSAADESVFGTHWVQFQPIQVSGELEGCQLTFLTVTADRVYRGGNQIAVNGSIVLRLTNGALALMLKVGLKDLFSLPSDFERPAFAYLQTASASTAKARQQSRDGEPGYKLFVYNALDEDTRGVLLELLSPGVATIGYSRKAGGMDVLVPLDLQVTDAEYTPDQRVIRTRSPEAATEFSNCTNRVLEKAINSPR
jgi:hypothetical protein